MRSLRPRSSFVPRVSALTALSLPLIGALVLTGCDRGGNPLALVLPASMVATAGNGQSAATSSAPEEAPTVRVTGALQNVLSGIEVTWEVTAGGGEVNPATSVTNGQGLATTTWTFGANPGEQELSASIEGLPPVVFSGTATGG